LAVAGVVILLCLVFRILLATPGVDSPDNSPG